MNQPPFQCEKETAFRIQDRCRMKLKLPSQTYSNAAVLPYLFHQLGSAREKRGA